MAWNDPTEITVAAGGQVNFAPVGTALPAKGANPTAALNAAFVGAGYITEDGATLTVGSEVQEFGAWQSLQSVRREKTGQEISWTFAMQQWNEENVPFAFGGGTVIVHGGGLFSYTFPADNSALDERSLVVDVADGAKNSRFVFPRGNVTEPVESQFARTSPALLPITFKVLAPVGGGEPGYVNTNDPGFAAGS